MADEQRPVAGEPGPGVIAITIQGQRCPIRTTLDQAYVSRLATFVDEARIEAVRLLSWRALDAALSGDPQGLEWALHSKVFGSETAVQVINDLVQVVGVSAYDTDFPLLRHLHEALAYPVIEGSNIGVRRRQMQALLTSDGYNPLAASGMA